MSVAKGAIWLVRILPALADSTAGERVVSTMWIPILQPRAAVALRTCVKVALISFTA